MEQKNKQYLICNWNERAFGLIIQLHSDVLRFGGEDIPITVIHKEPVNTAHLYENYGKFFYNVKFHHGDPSDRTVLRSAGVENAICVVVLSEGDLGEGDDARTILTFLALKKIREEIMMERKIITEDTENRDQKGDTYRPLFRVFLEFHEEISLKNSFHRLLRDHKSWVSHLSAKVIDPMLFGQAARTPGMVKFFFDILTYSNDTDEIYSYKLPTALVEKTTGTSGILFEQAYMELIKIKVSGSPVILVGAIKEGIIYTNPDPEEKLILDTETDILIMAKEPVELDKLISKRSIGGSE